eukprot:126582_1
MARSLTSQIEELLRLVNPFNMEFDNYYVRQKRHYRDAYKYFHFMFSQHESRQQNFSDLAFAMNLQFHTAIAHEIFRKDQEAADHRMAVELAKEICVTTYSADSNMWCSICRGSIKRGCLVRTLQCTHSFCPDCINQWLKIKNRCPICRYNVRD